jgi:hypothetical protein
LQDWSSTYQNVAVATKGCLVSLSRPEQDPRYPMPLPHAFALAVRFFESYLPPQTACSCQILAEITAVRGEMLHDPTPSMLSRPDHSPKNKADAMTMYECPEAKREDSATDEAGNPHAIEHDEIASGSENEDACMVSSPLPCLPPLPIWQSSLTRYNNNNNSWLVTIGGCDYNSFQQRKVSFFAI